MSTRLDTYKNIFDSLTKISPNLADESIEKDASTLSDKEESLELQRLSLIVREQAARLQHREEEHKLRKKYLRNIFIFIIAFVAIVMAMLYLCAAGYIHLANNVLITLLSTTTADIIGLLYIAFKWLFPIKP